MADRFSGFEKIKKHIGGIFHMGARGFGLVVIRLELPEHSAVLMYQEPAETLCSQIGMQIPALTILALTMFSEFWRFVREREREREQMRQIPKKLDESSKRNHNSSIRVPPEGTIHSWPLRSYPKLRFSTRVPIIPLLDDIVPKLLLLKPDAVTYGLEAVTDKRAL
jgi:hypothetical protein